MNKDLRQIVGEYLKTNGYDGLYQPGECSCAVDDLFPCEEPNPSCMAGYKMPCDCGEGCDYHIGPQKEAESK